MCMYNQCTLVVKPLNPSVETLSILMDLAYTSNSKLKVFKQYMWFTTIICDESILSSFSPQAYYFGSFVVCYLFSWPNLYPSIMQL